MERYKGFNRRLRRRAGLRGRRTGFNIANRGWRDSIIITIEGKMTQIGKIDIRGRGVKKRIDLTTSDEITKNVFVCFKKMKKSLILPCFFSRQSWENSIFFIIYYVLFIFFNVLKHN